MVKLGASFHRAAGWKRGHVYAVHPCCPPLRRGERAAVTLRRWSSESPGRAICATRVTSEPSFGRGNPTARPARWTSLFSCRTWNPAETEKARSVVALSCVTRFGRGRRFASGCWSVHWGWSSCSRPSTTGVFPASCPEIHRPARNHRHVRIWAERCIGIIDPRCKSVGLKTVQDRSLMPHADAVPARPLS
jgi:hypothetical protein